jgi:peptidylprolyl isomerase
MAKAKSGDTVNIHYTGTLGGGEVFDSSEGSDPLEFTLGEGQVIQGFDDAVTGMEPGEEKTVTIPAEQAYGERHDDLVTQVDRSQFPADLTPEVGQQLQVTSDDGQPMAVTVSEIGDEVVTLDANHPLAGQALTFKITLMT